MSRFFQAMRKLPLMEMLGIVLFGVGLCFAITAVGISFDDQRAKDEKPKIQQSVEEMKGRLVAAEIPDDQIAGLLVVHKSALVKAAVHQHFIITSFLVLLGLFVASFGFTLTLWGKLRAITRQRDFPSQKDEPETANTITGANSRSASQFDRRGIRRCALVAERHGRFHGGAAVAQFCR